MPRNKWYEDKCRGYYDDDGNNLRGGNDEYYDSWCANCSTSTEHDVCTSKCVECEC